MKTKTSERNIIDPLHIYDKKQKSYGKWVSKSTKSESYNQNLKLSVKSNLQNSKALVEHQKLIDVIMIKIKPNLTDYWFKNFTKEMIKQHIREIKNDQKKSAEASLKIETES